jgi:hypothetical protein
MTVTNKIYDEFTVLTSGQDLALGGSVTVKQGAFLLASGDDALGLTDGPWKVKVDGTVESADHDGIHIAANPSLTKQANSSVTVGTEGTVWGSGSGHAGIFTGQATDITNAGLIRGETIGIYEQINTLSSTKLITITNTATGTIATSLLGVQEAILFNGSGHTVAIKNAGMIEGDVLISDTLQLTNSGVIHGYVNGGTAGASKVTNSGTIGDGTKALILSGTDLGVVNSGILLGTVSASGSNVSLTNSGTVFGAMAFGTGSDKVTNTGTMSSLDMGFGNNSMVNGGSAGTITFESGNDQVTNTKSLYSLNFGDGSNKLVNSGVISGTVTFGIGDDTASNTKTISGAVDLGAGHNTFTNGGVLESKLSFGGDNDVLKNTGTITQQAAMGGGNDSVTNSGTLIQLDLGEGNNTLINTGTILNLQSGTGNDTVKTTTVITNVNLGDGNDTFVGGAGNDRVFDGLGNDSYTLGAGDDLVTYKSGIDVFDGGAGNDEFDALGATGLFINLDSKAFTLFALTVAGNSLNTFPAGAQVGTIKGFETVKGTSQIDIIHGSSAAEAIDGGDGGDTIIGAGGGDTLGRSGKNLDTDTYVYLSVSDSGTTKATRDTILGFEDAGKSGGDVISLALVDADSRTAADDAFTFIGNNQAFTKHAGELRAMTEGGDMVVQADVNGDGKADMTIAVVGVTSMEAGDFVL